MKNSFYTLLIFSLLISCKSNMKQPAKDTTLVKPINQTEELIEKFKPIIQGAWVKKDYVEKVITTKSPLAAMTEADDFILIYINIKNIKGDSLVVPDGNTHDGSQITIKFQSGKSPSTIKVLEGGEIGYSIDKGDTILYYSRFDEQKKKIITTKFVKVLQELPDNDLEFGLNHAINKAIIAGNYLLTDSLGKVSKVSFNNDGRVSGFSDFSKYHVNFDLNSDAMDNLDEIFFSDEKKIRLNHLNGAYSFKFDMDTLSLYSTHSNVDSTELILGKRIYKLQKQK
ncbi:MAG: hypothetical protein ABI203_10550 [Mucilaginibacter sp.]